MSVKRTLMGATAALFLTTPAFAEMEVHDAYARSSNPATGAAFLILHNHGDTDDRLLGVTSEVAARTELHTHVETDGVMQMIHVEEGFDLPADGEILMERGGKHVMFMGLTEPLEQGDTVSITFQFETAPDLTVEIPVDLDRAASHGGHEHGSHDDGTMDHSNHDHGNMAGSDS